jgi:hypothetical protein
VGRVDTVGLSLTLIVAESRYSTYAKGIGVNDFGNLIWIGLVLIPSGITPRVGNVCCLNALLLFSSPAAGLLQFRKERALSVSLSLLKDTLLIPPYLSKALVEKANPLQQTYWKSKTF